MHAVFGLCFVKVATFIKPATEWNPSFSFKGICLSCIVPVLQIFVGLKDLNCSWVKQGLKSEGWQQILQDKVSFNLSIQGERLCTKCQWSHQNRKFIYRKQKGKERQEGWGWKQQNVSKPSGRRHTLNDWKRPLMAGELWITVHSFLLRLWNTYHACGAVVISWSVFMTLKTLSVEHDVQLSCLASGNSQKSSIFHVTMGAERPREVTAKTDSKWPGLGGKAK